MNTHRIANSRHQCHGSQPPQLSAADLTHLAEAKYLASDDLRLLCSADWRANNLDDQQKRAVAKWLKLAEVAGV